MPAAAAASEALARASTLRSRLIGRSYITVALGLAERPIADNDLPYASEKDSITGHKRDRGRRRVCAVRLTGSSGGLAPMKFTVGLKHKGKVNHVVVDAEDALIAALKTKAELPDAQIMYVRRQNRRGDARHPPLTRVKGGQ